MILLDTCAVIWDALDRQKLTENALEAINKADQYHALIMSDISFWEIAMLMNKGRLELDTTASHFLNLYLQSRNISVIQISPEIAELSVTFGPQMSKDPADRIISATATVQNAQLITADQNLIDNQLIDTIW